MTIKELKKTIKAMTRKQLQLLAATSFDMNLSDDYTVKNMRKAILAQAEQMNMVDSTETEEEKQAKQTERIEKAAVLAKDEKLTSVQQQKLYNLQKEIEIKRSDGTIRELEATIPAWHIRLDDLVG